MKLHEAKSLVFDWVMEAGWKPLDFVDEGRNYSIECYKIINYKSKTTSFKISKGLFNNELNSNHKIKQQIKKHFIKAFLRQERNNGIKKNNL